MTDEHTGTEAGPVDPLAGWRDLTVDELMARKAEYEEHGLRFYNHLSYEQVVLGFALGNFSSAFLQALGKQAADGAMQLPKRVGDLVRKRVQKKGKPDGYEIGVDDGSAATIAFTAHTPDEARLALLDLDVTAEGVRGKVLHWDSTAEAWQPEPDR